ncbi:MAG: hypothetical protein ACFFCS_19280 [Candidatus Hodarchaeota archaeon]
MGKLKRNLRIIIIIGYIAIWFSWIPIIVFNFSFIGEYSGVYVILGILGINAPTFSFILIYLAREMKIRKNLSNSNNFTNNILEIHNEHLYGKYESDENATNKLEDELEVYSK